MPRIALIVNVFPKLSESFIVNKVRLLTDLGFAVTLVAHDRRADPMPPDLIGKARVLTAPSAYGLAGRAYRMALALIADPSACFALWRQTAGHASFGQRLKGLELYAPFAGRRFDIIHFSFSGLAVTYLPVLFLLKKKSLLYVSCRGHAEQILPLFDPVRRTKLAELFAIIDRVHCVSDEMIATCVALGLNRTKAFVNRPAINPADFSPGVGEDAASKALEAQDGRRGIPLRIAAVGRLHWKKGFDTLLQAMRLLIDQKLCVHLDIVGGGPEREKLMFLTHELGLSRYVTFCGALDHAAIRDLLAKADVFAHPSLSEGISNAVMEAMAMELPVVCTDAGGMCELIAHERNGICVPILNPAAMANAIMRLYHCSALRLQLGQAARQTILCDFSLERQRRVYGEEYALALSHAQV